VTFRVAGTAEVETANVTLALPAGTVTDAGILTTELSEQDKLTNVSTVTGAARVTVPVTEEPPCTVKDEKVTERGTFANTVAFAERLALPSVPVRVATVGVPTFAVVNGTSTDVCPAGIVTDVGPTRCAWVKLTWVPPAGAGLDRATVAVTGLLPYTVVGESLTVASLGAYTITPVVK